MPGQGCCKHCRQLVVPRWSLSQGCSLQDRDGRETGQKDDELFKANWTHPLVGRYSMQHFTFLFLANAITRYCQSLKNNGGWLGVTYLDSSLCWDFWSSLRNLVPFYHYSQKLKRSPAVQVLRKKIKMIRQLWVLWGCFWGFWAKWTSTAWHSCKCAPHPCTRK